MRRAMRHAHLLGATEPLMHRLVPTLVAEMGDAYPELRRAEPVIVETLRQEEERFRRTLGRGMALLDEATAGLRRRRRAVRRDRVQALRHLRLPARPHPGRGARHAASASTRPASTRPWSASARWRARTGRAPASRRRAPSGSRCANGSARPMFLGYEETEATGELLALVKDGAEVERGRGRRDRRGALRPHALLRRERRPGRRPRRDRAGPAAAPRWSTPRRRPATCTSTC